MQVRRSAQSSATMHSRWAFGYRCPWPSPASRKRKPSRSPMLFVHRGAQSCAGWFLSCYPLFHHLSFTLSRIDDATHLVCKSCWVRIEPDSQFAGTAERTGECRLYCAVRTFKYCMGLLLGINLVSQVRILPAWSGFSEAWPRVFELQNPFSTIRLSIRALHPQLSHCMLMEISCFMICVNIPALKCCLRVCCLLAGLLPIGIRKL